MISNISDEVFSTLIENGSLVLNNNGEMKEDFVKFHIMVAGPLSKITGNKVKPKWGVDTTESIVFYSSISFRFEDLNTGEFFGVDKIAIIGIVDIRPKSGPNGGDYGRGYVKIGFKTQQAYWLIEKAQIAHDPNKENVDIKKYLSDENNGMVWLNVNIDDASKQQKPLRPKMISDDPEFNEEFNSSVTSLYSMLSMADYVGVYAAVCIMKVGLSITVPNGGTPDQVVGKPLNISFRCKGMGITGQSALLPPSSNDDTVYFK